MLFVLICAKKYLWSCSNKHLKLMEKESLPKTNHFSFALYWGFPNVSKGSSTWPTATCWRSASASNCMKNAKLSKQKVDTALKIAQVQTPGSAIHQLNPRWKGILSLQQLELSPGLLWYQFIKATFILNNRWVSLADSQDQKTAVVPNTQVQTPFSFSFCGSTEEKKEEAIKRSRALINIEEMNSLQISLRKQFQHLCLALLRTKTSHLTCNSWKLSLRIWRRVNIEDLKIFLWL